MLRNRNKLSKAGVTGGELAVQGLEWSGGKEEGGISEILTPLGLPEQQYEYSRASGRDKHDWQAQKPEKRRRFGSQRYEFFVHTKRLLSFSQDIL